MPGFNDCKTLDDKMLLTGLDRLDIGCGLFDAAKKLVGCNDAFTKHGGYPEALCRAGISLDRLQRFQCERAGKNEVSDLASTAAGDAFADSSRIVWRDRAGRMIEQRLASLDQLGLVSVSADITDYQTCTVDLSLAHDATRSALADLETAQQQLDDAERLAALGELTAGVAHEIKNPLNFINNFAHLSLELIDDLMAVIAPGIDELDAQARADIDDLATTLKQNLVKINQHGCRADAIVRTMLLHARRGTDQAQTAPLNAIVEEAINLARQDRRLAGSPGPVDLRSSLAPDVGKIECYPDDLVRALFNVIANGVDAACQRSNDDMPTVEVVTRAGDATVDIVIEDNGVGMQDSMIEQALTPFFTTKPPGEGTGLGLSLSHDVIGRQHRGHLDIVSEIGRFTRVTLTLPKALPDRRHRGRRHDDG